MATRDLLTANRTYYVRTDGNDSNDGLTDTPSGAKKTLQGAYNLIASTIDIGGNVVTVQVGPGTYTAGAQDTGKPAIGGRVFFQGDPTTPSNVVIDVSASADDCFLVGQSEFVVSGFRMLSAGSALHAARSGTILTGPGLEFGTCTEHHMFVDNGGHLVVNNDYKIIGGAQTHYYQHTNGYLAIGGVTVTIQNVPNFSVGFAVATIEGVIEAPGITFSGATTGVRFIVDRGGNIYTGYAGVNYFPGDVPGYVLSGFYDDSSPISGPPTAWTPLYGGFSTAGSTTQTQIGSYVRIGDMVWIQGRVVWTAHSGGSGGACIMGLPFQSADDTTLPVWYSGVTVGSGKQLTLWLGAGTNTVRLIASDPAGTAQAVVPVEGTGDVMFSGLFRVFASSSLMVAAAEDQTASARQSKSANFPSTPIIN